MDTINVFVYGTLRPGEALFSLVSDSVVEMHNGSVNGRLYAHECGVYPVANLLKPGTIVGTMLKLNFTDDVLSTIRMEIRAGYRPMHVSVAGEDGISIGKALTFHYEGNSWGQAIPSGDWFQYEQPPYVPLWQREQLNIHTNKEV